MATLTLPTLRPVRRGALNLLLLASFLGTLFFVVEQKRNPGSGGGIVRRQHSLATVTVANGQGQAVPLVPFGGGVVLVVGKDCATCQSLLRSWAEAAGEEYLIHLHLVSLEGPQAASRLIELQPGQPTLRPGQIGGPAAEGEAWLRSIGARRLPALLHVSPEGELLEQQEGELTPEEASSWLERAR